MKTSSQTMSSGQFVLKLWLCLNFFAKLVFVASTDITPTTPDPSCTPSPNPGAEQYIIGYGSLMSSASKNRTVPGTGPNIPIILNGYARSWNCKGVSPTLSTTYLGTYPRPGAAFNAAIFRLDGSNSSGTEVEKALRDFDRRESFYCRKEVGATELKFYGNESHYYSESAQFWIYITKPEYIDEPSEKYPIVESYVDTWLTGCLEIEEKFGLKDYAAECIRGTEGWSEHWVNDRIYPRRPLLFQPNAAKIDKLLNEIVPETFAGISVAGSVNGSDSGENKSIFVVLILSLAVVFGQILH